MAGIVQCQVLVSWKIINISIYHHRLWPGYGAFGCPGYGTELLILHFEVLTTVWYAVLEPEKELADVIWQQGFVCSCWK